MKDSEMTVDDYLKALPSDVRETLHTLRMAILSAAPDAEELISYQIPTYKQNGPLVHFAAFAKHCSLIVVNKELITLYKSELTSYKISGTTIQFTPDHPIDLNLVRKIVKARIAQNTERMTAKELAKRKPSASSTLKKQKGGSR